MTNTNGIANVSLVLGQSNAMTFSTIGVPYPSGWPTQSLNGGYAEVIWNIVNQNLEQYVAGINSEVVPVGSSAWGPETGIAMTKRGYSPQRSSYFIKYAVGSTGLAMNSNPAVNDWSPYSQGKAFGKAMDQFDLASAALMPYRNLEVDTCYWIGNETDTQDAISAAAMVRDLPAFAEAIRDRTKSPDMKFVLSLVKNGLPNGGWTADVRAAQIAVGSLRRNAYVETNDLTWTGGHYDPSQVIILGQRLEAAANSIVL